MKRSLRPAHPMIALLAVTLAAVGLVGAYRYWESYYQHRGFATVAYLPHARRGHLVDVNFYSTALHRETDYLVYLPPGYGAGRRYPVYYLLHGSPGRPKVFIDIASMDVRMDNLISQHRMRPMILVMPDGRIDGSTMSDSEWANTPSGDYANYVLNVVANVDQRFDTIANRHDRVIAGFSAGAFGATNIALHNLGTFAGLQAWSGYYTETRTGVFKHASRATLVANSPLLYVRRLSRQLAVDPLRAFLFVGRDDDDSPQTEPMAAVLARAGGSVSYALYHGGHDWQLWHAHLDQMLILASRDTTEPLPRHHSRARTLTPGVVPLAHGKGRRGRRARHAGILLPGVDLLRLRHRHSAHARQHRRPAHARQHPRARPRSPQVRDRRPRIRHSARRTRR